MKKNKTKIIAYCILGLTLITMIVIPILTSLGFTDS